MSEDAKLICRALIRGFKMIISLLEEVAGDKEVKIPK
jgi:hypothetical protein